MAFPQPDADEYAINGYTFFRLNTPLASPGDIYESAQSGLAFALGPDSDIATVTIAYFDQQQENLLNMIDISPARSVVSRLDANNLSTYLPAQRPAKILLWPADLWNPNYVPGAFTANSTLILETPTLDVIQYFQQPASLVPHRNDREWFYQDITMPPAVGVNVGKIFVVVPFYGRKYASVFFKAKGGLVDVAVAGITLLIDAPGTPPATTNAVETTLDTRAATLTDVIVVDPGALPAKVGGMYDLLQVGIIAHGSLSEPTGVIVKIITSDTPAGG